VRILQVIQEMQPGGAERVVLSLVDGAAAAGATSAVAAAPGPLDRELRCARFGLPIVDRRPLVAASAALRLRDAVRRFQPDVVHCHNPGMALVAAPATRRGTRPRGLVTVHGVPDGDYAAAGRILRLAGLPVIACGPGVASALEERGVRVRQTVVNGVSPPPAGPDRASLVLDLGLPALPSLVVSVGRLVPQKNHALALRAVARLPEVGLVVVGEGPLRPALDRLAGELGITDRVSFAGQRADARELIGAADALVISSRWEGLPLVALEALVAGTPLVATAVRGVRELLRDGDCCLLVSPEDPSALADALRRVTTDAALRGELSSRGRAFAGRFTEAAMVAGYLRIYQELGPSNGEAESGRAGTLSGVRTPPRRPRGPSPRRGT
jgi:glycosyltransferase involved in cell wall biosynthesis